MKAVLRQVLSSIKPSAGQAHEEVAFARKLVKRIKTIVPQGCDVVLAGSIAKGTFLQDKRDVDIFVVFDRSVPKDTFEWAIKKIMEAAFPRTGYQLSYAEHPYVRFHFQGRRIDLVPAYRISKAIERLSAVDRSVLHTEFVLGSLKKGQTDDVLLLKAFLRANSLYGAEIKVQGFSGYLCELLVINYGGFVKLVQTAAKWKEPVFIDVKKYYKSAKKQKKSKNQKIKKQKNTLATANANSIDGAIERFGFFVVIDPTDMNRNVAAAVSRENFRKFTALCRKFLKKPAADHFLKKPETFEQTVAKSGHGAQVFMLTMPRPNVVDDVLWGQLNRMAAQLQAHLAEFKPKEILADDGQHLVRLAIILGKDKLPPELTVEGPPLEMKKHVQSFKKSHRKAKFIKKQKRIYAIVKRPVPKTRAEAAIIEFFRSFQKTKSHLACAEELIVLERVK